MKKILIMSRRARDVALFRELLGETFFIYSETDSGREALDLCEEHDCTLLGDSLADMSGLDFLEMLGAAEVLLRPVILISSRSTIDESVAAMKMGVRNYLQKKSLTADVLSQAVHDASTRIPVIEELKHSQEKLNATNLELEREITERKKIEEELLKSEVRFRKMARLSSLVIHNIDNLLTTMKMSCSTMKQSLDGSRLIGLARVNTLLTRHQQDLAAYIGQDPKGSLIPEYLKSLEEALREEQVGFDDELKSLWNKIEIIREVIESQQDQANRMFRSGNLDLSKMISEVINLQANALSRRKIHVIRNDASPLFVMADKIKMFQILINLTKNIIESLAKNEARDRLLSIHAGSVSDGRVYLELHDTRETQFATTDPPEKAAGFGLSYSVLAMREMDGDLYIENDRSGFGALFRLHFAAPPKATI